MPKHYFGYPVRDMLYGGEEKYFRENPHVSGMAAEDGRIIFNPYSQGVNRDSIGRNEAARLWMEDNETDPTIDVSPEQEKFFKGTPYEKDELKKRQTILARIVAGDPSVGKPTPVQKQWADWLLPKLENNPPVR